MSYSLSFIIISIFSLFPLVIWGYGTTFLSEHVWNRGRFLFGMVWGALSVILISLFSGSFAKSIELKVWAFLFLFWLLGTFVWWLTKKGSPYIWGFLRRTLLLHSIVFCIIFIAYITIQQLLSISGGFFAVLFWLWSFLIAASVEEWVKHISTLWLTSREFRFSRRDFLLFTFFITLGFVTLENSIYMYSSINLWPGKVFLVWLTRLLFSLPLHVFAAAICVMMWWKALSYKLFSPQYILLFVAWYVSAVLVHGSYNLFIDRSYLIPLFVLTGVGYFSFTQWLLSDWND